jgi:Cd2+/Zn2+-exporting ATPase/Cu+-exporting ATPase
MNERGVAVPSSLTHERVAASDVFVARAGQILGVIAVADTVRPEAKKASDALNSMSIRTVLLAGDSRAVAEAVAAKLGIKEVVAEALPEEKLAHIRVFVHNDRRTVAMVGDGVNDAPALVEASVRVAMGSGTDVARESADVVCLATIWSVSWRRCEWPDGFGGRSGRTLPARSLSMRSASSLPLLACSGLCSQLSSMSPRN